MTIYEVELNTKESRLFDILNVYREQRLTNAIIQAHSDNKIFTNDVKEIENIVNINDKTATITVINSIEYN